MKSILLACAFFLAAGADAIAQDRGATPYPDLLAKAKRGDPDLDFLAFRYGYAASESYDPYGEVEGASKSEMDDAFFNKQDCVKALVIANKILAVKPIDIDAHMVGDKCSARDGDQVHAAYHQFMARGLIKSLMDSGDGRSAETAYVVISVEEEYVLLAVLGLKPGKQALIHVGDHDFDSIDASGAGPGQTTTLFFNIDRPMHQLTKELTPKKSP
jgi:hypothetical protein